MSKQQPESDRKYTLKEQNEGLIGRRVRAFADRSREPGDAATWAVVLGATMWTLLIICYSVADQALLAFVMFVLTIAWVVVMGVFGRVNVASILWGSATSDADEPPVEIVVFQSTLVVTLLSLVSVTVNAVQGWEFGWYGFALLAALITYLLIYVRTYIRPDR